MTSLEEKLQRLRDRLGTVGAATGPLLVVYPPESELDFSSGYGEVLKERRARRQPMEELDLRPFVFDLLDSRRLLDKTFALDVEGGSRLHGDLANMIHKELVRRLIGLGDNDPAAVIFLRDTSALFPWVSYSGIIEEVESVINNTIVIPFPGTERGPELHFMGAKDGYNYRAARI